MKLTTWLASRPRKSDPVTIVLHATAGSTLAGAISTLRLKGLSYNYLIEDDRNGRDGEVTKCVPYSRVAFHAGVSSGPTGANVNDTSIGICFVNLNDGKDPYSDKQYESAKRLIKELRQVYPSLKWITTHYAITVKPNQTARKTDPRGFDDFTALAMETGLSPWKPAYARRYVA